METPSGRVLVKGPGGRNGEMGLTGGGEGRLYNFKLPERLMVAISPSLRITAPSSDGHGSSSCQVGGWERLLEKQHG